MDKFCVFCGQRPESKNREHVIPKWLIELTGDPNRTVYLGRDWTSPDLKERKFALSSFTFPACGACNSRFSDLEARAQFTVGAILARRSLGAEDWSAFLDWLDKVRTGLWLGQIYLNRNYRGIDPVFHIQNRIGAKDRLAVIYALREDGHTGVGWSATDTPLFQSMPSCFTLAINSFLFLNASFDFLFSQRIGFPYPCKREMRPQGGYWLEMARGSQQHVLPLVERQLPAGGVFLLQPMIPWEHFRTPEGHVADQSGLYDNDFVRAHCMDYAAGRGNVFRQERGQLVVYPKKPSQEWIPQQPLPRGEAFHRTGVAVGHWLEDLYGNHASLEPLPEEQRRKYEEQIKGALSLHRVMTDHFLAQKDMYY